MVVSHHLTPLARVLVVTVLGTLSPTPILIRAAYPQPPMLESVWLTSDSVSPENRLSNSYGTESGQPSGGNGAEKRGPVALWLEPQIAHLLPPTHPRPPYFLCSHSWDFLGALEVQ